MSFLDHIRRCNAHDLGGFLPFRIGAERVGWVRPEAAGALAGLGGAFVRDGEGLRLADRIAGFEDRSKALAEGAEALVAAGLAPRLRGEFYGVSNAWGRPPLAALDRGAVPAFGVRAYGVHVNGWRRGAGGDVELWLGLRAADKAVAPGKLDNMVAGGQPIGLGLMENLVKEAAEEANAPEALARQARPVGCIAYVMEQDEGLKPDVMFCYDLEVPADFRPENTDGEMQGFRLAPAVEAGRIVAETDDFKFNVNLVVTDFLVRHGLIDPDAEPDYAQIVAGLRGAPEPP
ncbi:MAG: DUF4743 domain-containing protein [Alphaproteobacteria bacterium]